MDYGVKMITITKNLQLSKEVNSFDREGGVEAGTIAHGLLDIEESSNAISDKLLPRLLASNLTEEKVDEILFEIGEELRHILYHINDMRYFQYVKD